MKLGDSADKEMYEMLFKTWGGMSYKEKCKAFWKHNRVGIAYT